MRIVLLCGALIAAAPALAQVRVPHGHVLLEGRPGSEEGTPAAAAPPPANHRPTQLLRCPDGKGGILVQDTPCRPASSSPEAGPTSASAVIDLSQLQPRPRAEAPAPPPRVEDAGPSRLVKGMLHGAGKLALLLAAIYAFYRIGRYARDRFRARFAPPAPSRVPRRVR